MLTVAYWKRVETVVVVVEGWLGCYCRWLIVAAEAKAGLNAEAETNSMDCLGVGCDGCSEDYLILLMRLRWFILGTFEMKV